MRSRSPGPSATRQSRGEYVEVSAVARGPSREVTDVELDAATLAYVDGPMLGRRAHFCRYGTHARWCIRL